MFKVPDLMYDFVKGSVIPLPTLHLFHAFITVVTVPNVLAKRSLQKHFSLHTKLLRELKFCRSITSGLYVPVVQFEQGTRAQQIEMLF